MVSFWDTSAVVPLLVDEPGSPVARRLVGETEILVWWGTAVECLSAIARREREGSLSDEAAVQARQRLRFLRESWSEILATEEVREHAARLLLRHPLRAADALQLGAALRWAGGGPQDHQLRTLDHRMVEAARREGFVLLVEAESQDPETGDPP